MYKIEVIDEEQQIVTREAESDDEWDRDSTKTIHNIKGFHVVESEGKHYKYYDFVLEEEPQFFQVYFLLYAIYSTGDSFGHDEDAGIEYYGLYTCDQMDIARKNKKALEDADFEVILLNTNNEEYTENIPWDGYFESLTEVLLEPIVRLP